MMSHEALVMKSDNYTKNAIDWNRREKFFPKIFRLFNWIFLTMSHQFVTFSVNASIAIECVRYQFSGVMITHIKIPLEFN